MKLSIVSTSYQSKDTIERFIERIHVATNSLGIQYEIILVDDGSNDESKEIIKSLIPRHQNMKLIELSRNFGHHKAIMLGLEHAQGEYVFLIDSDLEEDPELVIEFFQRIAASNDDVIYGISENNGTNWLQKVISRTFWRLFRRYTKLSIPRGLCTVRIMKRNYVQALLLHKEVNVFLAGLWEITGFVQTPTIVNKTYKGSTEYTFARKFELALSSLISFSGRPLRLIALFGASVVFIALFMLFALVSRQLISGNAPEGWLSIITAITLFSGIQILSIGLVAIYVASILEEVKARPRTVIAKIWNKDSI
jgi:putative glycosyltransferase